MPVADILRGEKAKLYSNGMLLLALKKEKVLQMVANRSSIPWLITSLRVVLLPLLAYLIYSDSNLSATVLFAFLVATDLADGHIARRLGSDSKHGAYFDASADFILIMGIFLTFAIKQTHSFWIPLLIALCFSQFLFTGKNRANIYDPIGKYFGSFLYASILATLVFPASVAFFDLLLLLFAIASLASRILYITGRIGG
ncbi:MAG: CDP-alcohol phosphatidyltransferase family protein [Candidatus Methanomethylicus sp.]|nr:CDP-alcohol phosphatidyltransferase family protein [Candidatus Methanomethylicus sp.]